MQTALAPSTSQPALARYRSVRNKSISSVRGGIDIFTDIKDENNSKLLARFRRRSKSVTTSISPIPLISERVLQRQPSITMAQPVPPAPKTAAQTPGDGWPLTPRSTNIMPSPRPSAASPLEGDTASPCSSTRKAAPPPLNMSKIWQADDSEDAGATKARDQEDPEAAVWAEQVARLEAETDRILGEQRKRDMRRVLQSQLAAASTQTQSKPPLTRNRALSIKTRSPVLERFAFLTRGKKATPGGSRGLSTPTSSTTGSGDFSRSASIADSLASPTPSTASHDTWSSKATLTTIDSPSSAAHCIERVRVLF